MVCAVPFSGKVHFKSMRLAFIFVLLLTACASDSATKAPREKDVPSEMNKESIQSIDSNATIPLTGIDLFLERLDQKGFRIDTTRLKEVFAWNQASNAPTIQKDKRIAKQLPFPIIDRRSHFSEPATYFVAKWNETTASFKNGDDYLIMTWTIDATGIAKEDQIYRELIDFMGNFPCYMFRSNDKVYAIAHRLTNANERTKLLTMELRDIIDPKSKVYGHDNKTELIE